MPGASHILRSDGTGTGAEVKRAARVLEGGGLVAFPTDTVFALAASADRPEALAALAALTRRPADRPFAHLIADLADVERFDCDVPPAARRLMEAFWPGPLTLVLPRRGGGTVGLRLPDHAVARAILRAARCRVAATSANPSGAAPRLEASRIVAEFGDGVQCIVEDASPCSGRASTVLRVDAAGWRVLREGEITASQVRRLFAPPPNDA